MENTNEPKFTIISKWKKPGTRWSKDGDTYSRKRSGEANMAMVTMVIEGRVVTRHIPV